MKLRYPHLQRRLEHNQIRRPDLESSQGCSVVRWVLTISELLTQPRRIPLRGRARMKARILPLLSPHPANSRNCFAPPISGRRTIESPMLLLKQIHRPATQAVSPHCSRVLKRHLLQQLAKSKVMKVGLSVRKRKFRASMRFRPTIRRSGRCHPARLSPRTGAMLLRQLNSSECPIQAPPPQSRTETLAQVNLRESWPCPALKPSRHPRRISGLNLQCPTSAPECQCPPSRRHRCKGRQHRSGRYLVLRFQVRP